MNNNIRLRFAPSPTGFLHIGNLRNALFDYLAAKQLGGKLILRIEDTDQSRFVEGAIESLISILDWLDIKFDEGPHVGGDFGPYTQTERLDIYNKHLSTLLENGSAYHCFCTSERLQSMREKQQAEKLPPRYDRCCRDLSQEEVKKRLANGDSYVIRQKMPLDGEVIVCDELRGEIKFKASELDDHVLIKTNGIPTYQFANIVDDHEMKISHVLRGEEWIPSFPKNILLYQSFGWTPPKFIHPSLIMNKEGGKLSKRQGDVAVEDFRANGYLKEALINFCVLLGWHPKSDDTEIFTLTELEKIFNYKDLGISPSIFDIEKLNYLNGYYIRKKDLDELTELCLPYLGDTNKSKEYIKSVIALEQERLVKLSDIAELTKFFFSDDINYNSDLLVWKKLSKEEVKANLEKILELLNSVPSNNWNSKFLEEKIINYLKNNSLKVGDYLWPTRVSLTGEKASPSPFDVAGVLGKEICLNRVRKAIQKL